MSKKLLSIFIAFVMCITMISIAFAVNPVSETEDPSTTTEVAGEVTQTTEEATTSQEETADDPTSETESSEPSTSETESTEPSTSEPESSEPSTSETESTEPSTSETESTEPSTSEPESTEPSTSEPESSEPSTSEPESTEPSTSETESSEPSTSEPESTEPSTSEPESTEPSTSEPESTEPSTSEPESTEPSTSEPSTSEPESTEPSTSEPESTEPSTSEPESTEPSTSEPESTEPSTSEPESTEPSTSEPESTEPSTSESESTEPTEPTVPEEPCYLEFEVKTAPTCTLPGVMAAKCDCGKVFYMVIPATGHKCDKTVTKATTKANGLITETCSVCGEVVNTTEILKIDSATLSNTVYKYNGNVKIPKVTITDTNGNVLKKGTDYTLKSDKNSYRVGTYKVTITFIGNYSGTKTLTFKIVPGASAVKKLTATKNSVNITIKKRAIASGYQIRYATNKDMTNYKNAYIKNTTDSIKTIKNLNAGTKYYVKVRAYTLVNVNGEILKYYSAWSDIASVKTAK